MALGFSVGPKFLRMVPRSASWAGGRSASWGGSFGSFAIGHIVAKYRCPFFLSNFVNFDYAYKKNIKPISLHSSWNIYLYSICLVL